MANLKKADMTPEQLAGAAESINAIGRSCRGARLADVAAACALLTSLVTRAKAGAFSIDPDTPDFYTDAEQARIAALPDADAVINDLLEQGHRTLAEAIDGGTRQSCNYPLNDIIVAGEYDGQMHVGECPNCHAEFKWIAPTFAA